MTTQFSFNNEEVGLAYTIILRVKYNYDWGANREIAILTYSVEEFDGVTASFNRYVTLDEVKCKDKMFLAIKSLCKRYDIIKDLRFKDEDFLSYISVNRELPKRKPQLTMCERYQQYINQFK